MSAVFSTRSLTMKDGTEIFCRIKETGSPIWLVAVHGIGEHLERHNYLIDLFCQNFNVFQFDLRGHGRSGGTKGNVSPFSLFISDLGECLDFLKTEYRMSRYVLFGHSMGALIGASYMQSESMNRLYPEMVFFNAPPAGVTGPLGIVVEKAPLHWFEKIESARFSPQLGGLVDLSYLSHDPRVKENYIKDPLNSLKLGTNLLFGMVATARKTFSKPLDPKCPAYCTVGSADRIVNPLTLEEYFTLIEKKFKFHSIEEAFHEIHNEVERFRHPYFKYMQEAFFKCLH